MIVGGYHVANWMIGQVRDETQTDEAMLEYAGQIGADKNELLKAFHEVPSMSSDKFRKVVKLLHTLAIQLSKSAYQNLLQARFITEQKQVEYALQKSEVRFKELNATKDKFFSIIAHDLKNPFNSIMGFSDLLRDKINDEDYKGIDKYAELIQESSHHAMNLVLNLLEWARSQTGYMVFAPNYVDMVELIKEVSDLLSYSALQKSIRISKIMPQSVIVYADKSMMSTVLRNLISNAIKFTKPGGRIIISADKKMEELLISINDNGIGIKKDCFDKLFSIDENFSLKGTNNEQGTGIGLILCKEFMSKHNGKIWVESELGVGSTFYITIPLK
jgi:signal transduction histidine kinase